MSFNDYLSRSNITFKKKKKQLSFSHNRLYKYFSKSNTENKRCLRVIICIFIYVRKRRTIDLFSLNKMRRATIHDKLFSFCQIQLISNLSSLLTFEREVISDILIEIDCFHIFLSLFFCYHGSICS